MFSLLVSRKERRKEELFWTMERSHRTRMTRSIHDTIDTLALSFMGRALRICPNCVSTVHDSPCSTKWWNFPCRLPIGIKTVNLHLPRPRLYFTSPRLADTLYFPRYSNFLSFHSISTPYLGFPRETATNSLRKLDTGRDQKSIFHRSIFRGERDISTRNGSVARKQLALKNARFPFECRFDIWRGASMQLYAPNKSPILDIERSKINEISPRLCLLQFQLSPRGTFPKDASILRARI